MTFTYNPELVTPLDRMRFTLGDIYVPELRPNESYAALLLTYSEPVATMLMAESLASEYAQNPSSVSVGGVSVSYASLVSNWQAIAKRIRDEVAAGGGGSGDVTGFASVVVERFPRDDSEYRRPDDWYPGAE